jgi:hypothetical protein
MSQHEILSALLMWDVNFVHSLSVSQLVVVLFPLALRSHILNNGLTFPPLTLNKFLSLELNSFVWYLYSFKHISSMMVGFSDTFIVSKCVRQIICNVLQIYDFLNLEFKFLCTWINSRNVSGIPIYFWAFLLVLEISA